MIPYGRQSISEEDIQEVVKVLRSDFLTQGPVVPAFEKTVCAYTGAKHAVAVNSGTSALHIACLSLGLGPGDILWTSPVSFVASANCALYCGADVDFVDIDPLTFNLSVEALSKKLNDAEKTNKLPKIIVPVHFCGLSCDMEAIERLAKQYGFFIVEDACHAIGGKYKGKHIGSCQYSDVTVFSFHPVKTITTGEGGMATTNNKMLANKMELLRSHGITRDIEKMTSQPDGAWYYQQIDLGFNYRMTDIQAALGLSQMKRLDEFVKRRHVLASRYDVLLAGFPVKTSWHGTDRYSGQHLYVIRLRLDQINRTHREVFDSMREQGIGVNVHYIPIYMQPYYQREGFNSDAFPEANQYYREAISLPIYPELSEKQQDQVVSALKVAINI